MELEAKEEAQSIETSNMSQDVEVIFEKLSSIQSDDNCFIGLLVVTQEVCILLHDQG